MKPVKTFSITRFLLIYLLGAVTLVGVINTVTLYYLSTKAIENHLNRELVRATFTFQTFLSNTYAHNQNVNNVKAMLDERTQIAKQFFQQYPALNYLQFDSINSNTFQYQAWNKQGKLVIKSSNAPDFKLSDGTVGLSKLAYNHKSVVVFTVEDEHTGLTIMTGVSNDYTEGLKYHFLENSIYLFLISCPLLMILLWFILEYGLRHIKKVTEEVANRDPHYLEALNLTTVPIEVKPLVDELNKLFLMLRNAFEQDKRFTADAAHELKTPLAGLKTQAQVALKTPDPEKREAALKHLLSGVDRTSHVVQQLLTLSRMKPQRGLEKNWDTDLVKVTSEILIDLAPSAISEDIDLSFQCDLKELLIFGNSASLSILVRNLIDNAIRYTDKNGKVTVEIESKDKQAILRVTDNGPGIPDNLKQRVFERFFRVLGTNKPGSGLGLAIVQQIAQLHDAKIVLSNPKVGHGLIIEVMFPL